MPCVDDFSCTDEQFAVVTGSDQPLEAVLNFPSEVVGVQVINSTIHETETVGGTDHGIDGQVEDRTAMDCDTRQVAAVPFPRIGEIVFDSGQSDGERDHGFTTTSPDGPRNRISNRFITSRPRIRSLP